MVSYKRGIGRERLYSQADFDAVYSESRSVGYVPCYKASEYTTKGVWHNLRFEQLQPVQRVEARSSRVVIANNDLPGVPGGRWLGRVYNRFYVPAMNRYYENRMVRRSMGWLYYRAIR